MWPRLPVRRLVHPRTMRAGPTAGCGHPRQGRLIQEFLQLRARCNRRYASVMTTGVPMWTCWNNHSASGMCMRMHPCDAE
jgi:hypothetical protein